jgi:hypothetical protein
MLELALRRLTGASVVVLAAFLGACPEEPTEDPLARGAEYVASSEARRKALEWAVVNPDNEYSKRRLELYREEEWGALPLWAPRVRPVRDEDIGQGIPEPDAEWQAVGVEPESWTEDALLELGKETFLRFPLQVEPALRVALSAPDGPERYGLWRREGKIGGLVWVELPDGVQPAMTCASCHASSDGAGGVILGLGNGSIDRGRMMDDWQGVSSENSRWGPGRVDVTADDIENPTAIPDLRPVRFQTHLNRAATLRNDLIALAVRLETGIIVATGDVVRPGREMVFALSFYLWSLGDSLPEPPIGPGRALYERECGGTCHGGAALAGPPVSLSEVGTNPAIGDSPARTTGYYQTTSLRGLSDRALLMADGAVTTLAELLDGDRQAPGHMYGVELSPTEQDALLAFLELL